MTRNSSRDHPLESLGDQDREFVLRLVLASGSLKDLAKHYGVSYPTIRARLDKLIERLEDFLKGRPIDPVSDMLADLLAKGEVTPSAARAIQKLHKNELERRPHAKEG